MQPSRRPIDLNLRIKNTIFNTFEDIEHFGTLKVIKLEVLHLFYSLNYRLGGNCVNVFHAPPGVFNGSW